MCADPAVRPGGVVLAGLSFGCPQALMAAADPALRGRVRGVFAFGGYLHLESAIRFGLTGRFRWRGRTEFLRPDPYGRWVVAANYLHRLPGYGGAEDVARALGRLAALAGDIGFLSWEPSSDPFKREVMESVSPGNRELFRLFAPEAAREPDPILAEEIAPLLADTASAIHPDLALPASLPEDPPLPPVRLIHRPPGPPHPLHRDPRAGTLSPETRRRLRHGHRSIRPLPGIGEERGEGPGGRPAPRGDQRGAGLRPGVAAASAPSRSSASLACRFPAVAARSYHSRARSRSRATPRPAS